jgi:DNA-directed RNA polymerase subunit L
MLDADAVDPDFDAMAKMSEMGDDDGALAQILIYNQKVNFVSYRIVHPLLPKMIVRFSSKTDPVKVIEKFKTEAVALCESILKSV